MLKPVTIAAAALVLILLLIIVEYIGPGGKAAIFAPLNFDAAQTEAARATPPKLLVVVFVGADCPPCDKMDSAVWSDPSVTEWMRTHAVAVRINRADDPGHARSLGVQTVPTAILLDGKLPLVKIEGTQTAREVLNKFNAALADRPRPAPTGSNEASAPGSPPNSNP